VPLRPAAALLIAAACSLPSVTPSPTASPQATPADAPAAPTPERIADPQRLGDFLPRRISGRNPIAWHPDRASPSGTWILDDRTVTLTLAPIEDLAALLTPLELLGVPAQAVLDGQEVRGLKVQGHRAMLSRQIEPPHRARLDIVAVDAYHVRVEVEPSDSLDAPLAIADQLAIGNMIRLALHERGGPTPPSPQVSSEEKESP